MLDIFLRAKSENALISTERNRNGSLCFLWVTEGKLRDLCAAVSGYMSKATLDM